MTATLPTSATTGHPAEAVLAALLHRVTGVRGALVASVDGRPVASVLPSHDPGSTAAIVAASLGLGARLADLAGEGRLQEIVVRSASGYVVIYAVGERGVLTVLTNAAANLALLHLEARQVCTDLATLVEPLDRT
ncbi:roadblock/LC7 domain-containing protein [Aquihabitans sp. G128]|uniref:roadblock/LC7 domain-containing protein n=1 Tax=Aquihabitans sp. G128 TaxID=2849779 RepID=UPI001C21E2D0|nr:roadblock/LC7 domain-containing protein [Aquihabitans sp. G128]QXC59684.1 roadblock/LC7 domain-containing protein [Aquihabitans sp. G128]